MEEEEGKKDFFLIKIVYILWLGNDFLVKIESRPIRIISLEFKKIKKEKGK